MPAITTELETKREPNGIPVNLKEPKRTFPAHFLGLAVVFIAHENRLFFYPASSEMSPHIFVAVVQGAMGGRLN
jgi:hypothetical protein